MQAAANSAMDQSITIKRVTRSQDTTGHATENWNTLATVSGNLAQPTAGQMQNYDYLIGSLSAWQVRMPVGTDCRANDELSVSGLSVPLRVQVILAPQSYQTSLRLLATEIR
jgi:hypothetical protein